MIHEKNCFIFDAIFLYLCFVLLSEKNNLLVKITLKNKFKEFK